MKRLLKILMIAGGGVAAGGLLLTLGETLHWWRLWRHRPGNEVNNEEQGGGGSSANHIQKVHFLPDGSASRKAILWLSGVSDYGDSRWLPEQQAFVERLAVSGPGSVVVHGNVPASIGLDRRFRRRDIWRLAGLPRPPLWAWGLHNFWQFAFASVYERAYGGDIAQIIVSRLQCAGVPSGSPLLIVCGSAGAQVALASAPFLRAKGYERIYMVSLGGAFGSPHGLSAITRFAQLVGAKDSWSRAGAWLFPGRRMSASTCASAQQEGRLTFHRIGPHGHYGARSYLDDIHTLPDRKTYADKTFEAILQLPWWQEWADL